mmetsp:Transcript_5391/g.8267  ORF Transcript_5391/g.8267 Transcript_5391/m.8267 type:complete len:415 (-) Transcript_5391:2853-4097(-)
MKKALLAMQEKINEGDWRYQILLGSLGRDTDASENGALLVWKAIKALQEESGGLASEIMQLRSFDVSSLTQQTNFLALNTEVGNLGQHYQTSYNDIQMRLAQLEQHSGWLPSQPVVQGASTQGQSVASLHVLESRILALESAAGAKPSVSSFSGASASQVPRGSSSAPFSNQQGAPDLNKVFSALDGRIKDLEEARGNRCESPKGNFWSPGEVESMVVGEAVSSCGMFWDVFSVLVVLKKGAKTGKDVSDVKYSAERAQLTVCKTDLKGAMTHCLPPCLFGKNGASVSVLEAQKVGMQGCPSYSVWIGDGRDSYRDTLGNLLEAQTESVRETIEDSAGGKQMADWLLDAIILQWASYVQFVDKFYTKLVNVAKFTPSGAWRLVGRCSSAIFLVMRPFRTKVERLNDLSLPSLKA